jgi:hypothetical protein
VNKCEHQMIMSSGWRCLYCGKSREDIRWDEEMQSRALLTKALVGVTELLERLTDG